MKARDARAGARAKRRAWSRGSPAGASLADELRPRVRRDAPRARRSSTSRTARCAATGACRRSCARCRARGAPDAAGARRCSGARSTRWNPAATRDYTVVDQAVKACGLLERWTAKGYVNALLRGFLRERAAIEARARARR